MCDRCLSPCYSQLPYTRLFSKSASLRCPITVISTIPEAQQRGKDFMFPLFQLSHGQLLAVSATCVRLGNTDQQLGFSQPAVEITSTQPPGSHSLSGVRY